MPLQKLIATAMCALLVVACSTTHNERTPPGSPASLSRAVLILQEHPSGEITATWRPVEEIDLSAYQRQLESSDSAALFVPAASRSRDCDQENQDCYRKCMERALPRGYGGFTSPRKRGGKSEFCRGECQQAYDDCLELERLRPQEFTAEGGAIHWLKKHRTEVLVGSVLVIAGVAFVVVSAGAGLIVLAPVVLMTSPQAPSLAPLAEGAR